MTLQFIFEELRQHPGVVMLFVARRIEQRQRAPRCRVQQALPVLGVGAQFTG
jgi:hypothetical protein